MNPDDDPDLMSPETPRARSWAEWWASLPEAVRWGLLAGVGLPLWLLWLIGGAAVAAGLGSLWWPLAVLAGTVVIGVAVGVPVWLAVRSEDKP